MKKALVLALAGAMTFSLCACSSNTTEKSASASETEASEDAEDTEEVSGEEETFVEEDDVEVALTAGTTSDYGEVTLGEYKGLKADRTVYEVTDDDVEYQIENLIYEYTEYNAVDRAAAEGDVLVMTMTGSIGDEVVYDYSDGDCEIYLGDETYGSEFDEKLTGAKAGDEMTFSIAYEEDDEYADYPGETIDYTLTVNEVEEEVVPELNDDFIKDTLGYDSEEDMRQQIEEEIQEENNEQSDSDVKENLMQQVIDGSEFASYNEDYYDSTYDSLVESYEEYMSWYGCETLDDLLEMFDMTEDDLKDEALNEVYRVIAVYAIAEQEGLSLTEEEYEEGLEYYVSMAGYDSAADLVADYGNESLSYWILDDKVLDFLYDNAEITDVEGSEDEEYIIETETEAE